MSVRTTSFEGKGGLRKEGVAKLNSLLNRLDVAGGGSVPVHRLPSGVVPQYRRRVGYREAVPVQVQIVGPNDGFAAFVPFALGTPVTTPINGETLSDEPTFNAGTLAAGDPFGITLEAIAKDATGSGLLVGLVPASVNIVDADHRYVLVNSGGTLETAGNGYARLIWAAGTSGIKWCLLSLPIGSGGALPDGSVNYQVLRWDHPNTQWIADWARAHA